MLPKPERNKPLFPVSFLDLSTEELEELLSQLENGTFRLTPRLKELKILGFRDSFETLEKRIRIDLKARQEFRDECREVPTQDMEEWFNYVNEHIEWGDRSKLPYYENVKRELEKVIYGG